LNTKGEYTVLAIRLEEYADYLVLSIFVKLGKNALIVCVDETTMMSESDG
jgi:hypothetical protein